MRKDMRVKSIETPWIFDHPKSNPMLGSQFLELRHDTIRDVRDALCIEGVHHVLDDVHLILDGEVDEVGIDQDVERGAKLSVVLEEECARTLNMLSGLDLIRILQKTIRFGMQT